MFLFNTKLIITCIQIFLDPLAVKLSPQINFFLDTECETALWENSPTHNSEALKLNP